MPTSLGNFTNISKNQIITYLSITVWNIYFIQTSPIIYIHVGWPTNMTDMQYNNESSLYENKVILQQFNYDHPSMLKQYLFWLNFSQNINIITLQQQQVY